MPSLHELQHSFMREIFGVADPAFASHIFANTLSADHRIAIYRNNVHSTLHGALRDVYPVVERLVGEDFFRRMASDYLIQHPSPSGDLHEFGETFPEFISEYPTAAELVYLADTARLEWLYHRVFHAANHATLNLTRLTAIAPEQYGELKFHLHPATVLLTSAFPIDRIWESNQSDYADDVTINLNDGGVYLLLKRTGFTITITRITCGEFNLLQQLSQKTCFSTACEVASDADPKLDLNTCFQRFVAEAVIVDFSD